VLAHHHTQTLFLYTVVYFKCEQNFHGPAAFSRIFLARASKKDCFYESHQAMTCLVPSHFTQNVVPPILYTIPHFLYHMIDK